MKAGLGSRRAAIAGIVGFVACAIGAFVDRTACFEAWLVSWLFLLGISLGAMAQLYIHELTGGEWGIVLRPTLEAIACALPFVAILAIPLAFGLTDLFPWARGAEAARSELLQAKAWYLNVPAFIARNAAWLVAWSGLAVLVQRTHVRRTAVGGLLLYLVTVTFVAVDWVGSLVPEWYSTAIGIRLGASQFVAALAATVLLSRTGRSAATPQDRQDFGNLLLTFCMTLAYFGFAQYLIVWGTDLPHETGWYLPRLQTSWRYLGLCVVALIFAIPVVAMLFRSIKRSPAGLAIVCVLVLAGAWLDAAWLVLPSLRPQGVSFGWIDFAALVAQGGLWLAVVLGRRAQAPMRAIIAHG